MKTFMNVMGFLLALPLGSIASAQELKPVVVTESIGDTLDPQEREWYHLLPRIAGFQWAVFSLQPDSFLTAKVGFVRDGSSADTLISNYRTVLSLRDHIERVESAEELVIFSEQARRQAEDASKGVSFLGSIGTGTAAFNYQLGIVIAPSSLIIAASYNHSASDFFGEESNRTRRFNRGLTSVTRLASKW